MEKKSISLNEHAQYLEYTWVWNNILLSCAAS
jgi:hypothetical protein